MRTLSNFILLFIFLCTVSAQAAETTPPDVLARTTTEEVLAILKSDSDIKGNKQKILELVETKILPHFDFKRITQLAVGKHWAQADADQQSVLVDEFRTLLVRTYSASLSLYKNQTFDFGPLKMISEETGVTVKTKVKQPGKKPVSVDYAMEKTANGWKVYDVKVDGVSLVTTYRTTFANEVNRAGIEGLVKLLEEKNRANTQKS